MEDLVGWPIDFLVLESHAGGNTYCSLGHSFLVIPKEGNSPECFVKIASSCKICKALLNTLTSESSEFLTAIKHHFASVSGIEEPSESS